MHLIARIQATLLIRIVFLINISLIAPTQLVFGQTEISPLQKEGAEHKKEHDDFFESLHVVPPGMQWRIVNEAVRDARVQRLQKAKGERVQADTPSVIGTWRELGSVNQAGRICAVEFDEETGRVWAGGDGGTIWIGDTTGNLWTILNETRRINYPRLLKNIRLSDGKERLVVVSSSPRAYYQAEGSTEWTEALGLEEIQRWGGFNRAITCERDGRLEILCSGYEWDYGPDWRARDVIYRSIDSGATYQRVLFTQDLRSIWTDGTDNVLVVHYDTLSSLSSAGTLTKVSELPHFENTRSSLIAGTYMFHMMLAIKAADSTRFYISDDDGLTWNYRGSVEFGPFEQRSFCQTAAEGGTWLYGGMEVFRTDYDGYTWKAINGWGEYYGDPANKLHADIPSLSSVLTKDGRSMTFICTDGGLYTSRDEALTVKNIGLRNLNVSQYYGSYTSRDNVDVVSTGAQDQGYQRSIVDTSLAPREFNQMISGDYANLVSGDEGHSIFCVYPGFTLYIPEAELGWGAIGLEFPHKGHMWLPPLAARALNPSEVFLGGGTRSSGAYVYRYYSVGSELKIDSLPFDFGENSADVRITAIAISELNPLYWYVVTSNGNVWSSADSGVIWYKHARPAGLDGHYFAGNGIAIDPHNPMRFYLGGSGYGGPAVYVTDNAGETFAPVPGLPPCLVLSLSIGDNGALLAAATDVGAFVYDTLSKQWIDITEFGSPDQTYWHVEWVPPLGVFRFSTYGRGLWEFDPAVPTSVDQISSHANDLVIRGVLRNNLPALKVEAAAGQMAELRWYDVAGRKLETEYIAIEAGSFFHDIPRTATNASMVVMVCENGNVAAAAMPLVR